MTPMHILAVSRTTRYHSTGGFEDHIDTLYDGLSDNGHRITLVTTAHPDKKTLEIKRGNISFIFLPNMKPGQYSRAWWRDSAKKVTELLSQHHFDLIHSQSYGSCQLLRKSIPQHFNIKLAASFHGTNYDEYCTRSNVINWEQNGFKGYDHFMNRMKWRRQYNTIDNILFQKSDYLIATSNEQKTIFTSIYNADSSKIKTVYNGMNVDMFKPSHPPVHLKTKYGIDGTRIILGLSRMEPDKGLQFLIQSFPRILEAIPDSVLVIVGYGGYEPVIKARAKRLGLGNKIVFTGKIPFNEVTEFMNLSEVFVNYTIRQNGYDLTLVEAMACETPVIASLIGSHPTLIKTGQNGILVPLMNTDKLSKAIIDLLRDKNKAQALGKNGRKTILENFTDTHMINNTEAVFREIATSQEST